MAPVEHASLPHTRPRLEFVCLFALVVAYLIISFHRLGDFPVVHGDEPWIAAAPYKLATEGVFGSDLLTGYYNAESRSYQVPLLPLLQAVAFRSVGVSVASMRMVPVLAGAAVLLLTFALGRQLADSATGLVAATLLLTLRIATGHDDTGIPLLDIARIGRPDVLVPAFGLAAWYVWNMGRGGKRLAIAFAAGALAGMATLAHLYGVFWLVVLWILALLDGGPAALRRREPYLAALGWAIVMLPWASYVALGWSDFVGQMRVAGDRFDVLNPAFYLENIVTEVNRYRALDLRDASGALHILRPGLWIAVLGIPLATVARLRHRPPSEGSRHIAVVLISQVTLFTILIQAKFYFYVVAFWPVAMLCLTWMWLTPWRRGRTVVRVGLMALGCLVLAEGTVRIAVRHGVAGGTTSYEEFESRLATHIPAGARILGLQHYWLGLRAHPYRTWMLPIFLSDSTYHHAPVTLTEALEGIDPDVILVDDAMRDVLEQDPDPRGRGYRDFWRFLNQRDGGLVASVNDTTYGRVDIYHLPGNQPQ